MLKQRTTIEGFVAGEQEAFKLVYAETKDFLFRVIYRMVGTQQETEDLLHDIYVKIFEKHHTYQSSQSSLKTWLYHISVNHTVNYLKRKNSLAGKLLNIFEMQSEDEVDPGIARLESPEAEAVNKALAKVDELYRLCIILKDIEERSYKEIAEIMELSVGAVKTRLNRGRKQFIKYYNREVSRNG